MQKEIFEKIFAGGVLAPTDMTAEEKKKLYQIMTEQGASEMFAYTRFFRDGFAEWEIEGIWKAKIDYLRLLHDEEKLDIEVRCTTTVPLPEGEINKYRHFYRTDDGVERSFDITEKGDFWRFLGDIRHRTHFGDYMSRLGMLSQTTVAKRFAADDWKMYEKTGLHSLIDDYIASLTW